MKFISIIQSGGLLLVLNISACSQIKSSFPDKTKEYQLTHEIAPLQIPTDLTGQKIQQSSTQDEYRTSNTDLRIVSSENRVETPVNQEPRNTQKKSTIYIELVEYSGGATRIRIEDNIDRSWRRIGKALSHHSIEITDRNQDDKVYFVQYDENFKKVEDGSLWDEALFIFGDDPAQEKEFRIKLAENGALTEVIVLDSNDRTISNGAGLKLLKLLFNTVKQDLGNL